MKYENTKRAVFLDRPNRFIAHVDLNGQTETVHVKNTGRCKELLIPGTEVILEESVNPARKTKYDLICVNKSGRWINMDSQVPNKAAADWIRAGRLFPEEVTLKTEKVYGNSIEVKGVTLEENDIARFPDAPTQRGVKHVEELIRCQEDGYEAYLLFVIQMKGIREFEPNWSTHPQFGEVLQKAQNAGVHLLAYDCLIREDYIEIQDPVPIRL